MQSKALGIRGLYQLRTCYNTEVIEITFHNYDSWYRKIICTRRILQRKHPNLINFTKIVLATSSVFLFSIVQLNIEKSHFKMPKFVGTSLVLPTTYLQAYQQV